MNNNIIISNNNKKRKKVPLYVFVSEGLAARLRRFIALKHQTTEKGLLSLEVEQAIMNHLAVQSTQQQNTQIKRSYSQQNQLLKINKVMEDIQKYLIESQLYVDLPQFIPEKHLDQAIANLRGVDKRTIKIWKQNLEQYGHIRKSGLSRYEIL
jgi:predicted transcriptional regulator